MRRSAAAGSASSASPWSKWGRNERRKSRPNKPPLVQRITHVIATSERGLAAERVRPVDHERAGRRQDHVVRMQVEMQEALAGAGRFQAPRRVDLVQPLVQFGEEGGVTAQRPGSPAKLREHRRPVDPVEDERFVRDLQHTGHRIAVAPRMLHDQRLALGVTSGEKAPQNPSVAEVEDLGSAPNSDEFHVETLGEPIEPRP
jgi:hypothetical protein